MTTMVHLTTVGTIWVRTETSGSYGDTVSNFALDYGSPAPTLPPGADEQIYEVDVRHPYHKNGNVIGGGPLPWPTGDTILGAISTLLANQAARREAEAAEARAASAAEAQAAHERALAEAIAAAKQNP